MTTSYTEQLQQGLINYQLLPIDYARIIENSDQREKFLSLFEKFQRHLEFLSNLYASDAGEIILFTNVTRNIFAQASPGKITVSKGAIDFLLDLHINDCLQLQIDGIDFNREAMCEMAGFWIVAHEYFHITRGHLKLCSKLYAEHSTGFEYDADNLASAALFRFARSRFGLTHDLKSIKCIALLPIFWCIKTLIHFGHHRTVNGLHPAWEVRLAHVIAKLSHMGVPLPRDGYSPVTAEHEEYLIMTAFHYEKMYAQAKEPQSSTFLKWIDSGRVVDEFCDPPSHWEKIQNAVQKNSMLHIDR